MIWKGHRPKAAFSRIDVYSFEAGKRLLMDVFEVACGFPSPAQDYLDIRIDLNKELVQNPDTTFFGRVRGCSMEGEGFREGDLLIIDRSKPFKDGAIACCCVDGEFTIKRIRKHKDYLELLSANPAYPSIRVNKEQEFLVWGIVIHHIRNL